jgi:arylsulfatase A-like enzyme
VIDVAPTLLDYAANLSFPNEINIAGRSFKDILIKKSQEISPVYGEYGQTRSIRIDDLKLVTRLTGHKEIYDLSKDPKESRNVVNDVMYWFNGTVLENEMRKWFSYFEDPMLSGWSLPVTGDGQLESIVYNKTGHTTKPIFNPVYNNHDITASYSGPWWDYD